MFQKKFLAQDMPADEQARKHFADDFDPRYGLGGEVAHSILDWERRVMENAVKEFKGGLRLRYISERGLEVGGEEDDLRGELKAEAVEFVFPSAHSRCSSRICDTSDWSASIAAISAISSSR